MAKPGRTSRKGRPWWQVLVRLGILLVLALVVAYATLPYWAAPLVRSHAESHLASQLGLPVTVEACSLSWSEGVKLTGVRVGSEKAFAEEPLVRVDALRTDFSPVSYLLHGRLEYVRLESLQLNARFRGDGTSNLTPLTRLRVPADRLSVHEGTVSLAGAGSENELIFHVTDLQFQAGQLRRLGSLTLSARLAQPDRAAPLSVRLEALPNESKAAQASFSFADVQLARLPLIDLLGLPLDALSGTCHGQLALDVNRQGRVENAKLDLGVRDLRIDPAEGPILAVPGDRTRISIDASYDPLTGGAGTLNVRQATIVVPGAELTGQAVIEGELLAGSWEAFRKLDVAGTVVPSQLSALLTGRSILPGELEADGAVAVNIRGSHAEPVVQIDASADATDLTVRRRGKMLKQAGTALRGHVSGTLDERNWRFQGEDTRLELGRNVFIGRGAIDDLRRLIVPLWTQGALPKVTLAVLREFDWRGTMEIRDADSLHRALQWLAPGENPVHLEGIARGTLVLEGRDEPEISIGFALAEQASLRIGDAFHKPPGPAMSVSLSARAQPERARLVDIQADLHAGTARVHVENGFLDLAPGDDEGWRLRTRWELGAVERLATMVPPAARAGLANRLAGDLRGQLDLRPPHGDAPGKARFKARLDRLTVARNRWFVKSAGPAELSGRLTWQASKPAARIELTYTSPEATGRVVANTHADQQRPTAWRLTGLDASADIRDAAWLHAAWPRVRELLGPKAKVTGQGDVAVSLAFEGDRVQVRGARIELARFSLADSQLGRSVPNGTTLAASLTGVISRAEALDWRGKASVALGDSQLKWNGLVSLADPADTPTLRKLDGRYELALSLDGTLAEALPELADLLKARQAAGVVTASGKLTVSDGMVDGDISADATRASLANLARKKLALPGRREPLRLVLSKPRGTAATLTGRFSVNRKTRQVDLSELTGRLGPLRLGGKLRLSLVSALSAPTLLGGDLNVRLTSADELAELVPALAAVAPTGTANVRLHRQGNGGPLVCQVDLRALSARLDGQRVSLTGAVRVHDPLVGEDGRPGAGKLTTDKLTVAIDGTTFWLVADLANLPEGPSGTLHVLATEVDLARLRGRADHRPTSQPTTSPTDVDADGLRRQIRRILADAQPAIVRADLTGRVSLGTLTAYEARVRQSYRFQKVEATFTVRDGQAEVLYEAGMNGGLVEGTYRCRLDTDQPVVRWETRMSELIPAENLQPQIAWVFPNNRVEGLFSRTEQAHAPLADVLTNLADARVPVNPDGRAVAVAEGGVVLGRAGPRFLTSIFPGLNLARYRYEKMTGYGKLHPDGSQDNEMIFSGEDYDLYIEGTTNPGGLAEYEIGLILLGTNQPASWHRKWRQGRLPVLNFTGRIVGGEVLDEQVSYPWPDETLGAVFVRNNIVYRLWVNRNDENPPLNTNP